MTTTNFNNDCCNGVWVQVLRADGSTVLGQTHVMGGGGFIDATTLPATEAYRIRVTPDQAWTGSLTMTLYDVVDIDAGSISFGGTQSASLTTPGQVARTHFTGTAGQRFTLALGAFNHDCCSGAWVTVLRADGTTSVGQAHVMGDATDILAVALPSTEQYTILIDPDAAWTGTETMTLYQVIDIDAGTMNFGDTRSISIVTPGQVARVHFNGVQGDSFGLSLSAFNNDCCDGTWVTVLRADGSTVVAQAHVMGGATSIPPTVLPASEQYTILITRMPRG